MNITNPITKEECDVVAVLYDSIMVSMRNNKIKDNYYVWESLKVYFQSREPKFEHKHFSNTNTPYTLVGGSITEVK